LSHETVFITEKIDGTNGIIHITPDGVVVAGSRNRWVTDEAGVPIKEDNYGFGAWVYENRELLKRLGAGTHYGEWYGLGIQRGYGLSEKRWASFDIRAKHHERGIPGVDTVPTLCIRQLDSLNILDEVVAELSAKGSTLVPGFMDPEGIVISFKNMNKARFKKYCKNDMLRKSDQEAMCAQP
jgi:hypothetical protein